IIYCKPTNIPGSSSISSIRSCHCLIHWMASYLLYLGIYSASISVSKDSRLRQSIRKAAIKESTQFLDSIGTAEMGQELEKRVIAMTTATRQNMERETGISSSFDEDIRKYLQEALQEIRRGRNDGNHHK
ncbi:MAG: hypothetical protein QN720_07375, partial [Nitrososphaeraceae archaeon]|nr:hypothetical protein [Nitrososphaeraceae archaeon]MDW0332779.1 hypothetical protein [Nitrososphaeraceae archaeon]